MADEEKPTEDQPIEEKEDAVETVLDRLKPAFQKLSLGSVMGYCSGMALKKVGRAMAFAVGLGFVAVQSASYAGYIEVNWGKVAKDSIVKPLDTTGDGKLDLQDAKAWWRKLRNLLTYQLPDATGFSLGFAVGVQYG